VQKPGANQGPLRLTQRVGLGRTVRDVPTTPTGGKNGRQSAEHLVGTALIGEERSPKEFYPFEAIVKDAAVD